MGDKLGRHAGRPGFGDKARHNIWKANKPSKTRKHEAVRQGETRPLGRRTHHPTHRRTCGETMGDNGRQVSKTFGKADTPSNKGKHVGRHWETIKTTGDKDRQEGTQGQTRPPADTPSNTVTHLGTMGGRRTIQQRETRRGTMGDQGRQDPREGGHTIQQRETRRSTMGDYGRQDLGKRRTHHPTTRKQEGVQWETKRRQDPREGGHTIQQRETRRSIMGDRGRQDPGDRRTYHPTKGNKKGYNGRNERRQDPRKGRTHHPTPRRTP